jgi:hypothetical protein
MHWEQILPITTEIANGRLPCCNHLSSVQCVHCRNERGPVGFPLGKIVRILVVLG